MKIIKEYLISAQPKTSVLYYLIKIPYQSFMKKIKQLFVVSLVSINNNCTYC
jgi:hypothetical protein